MTHLQTSLEVLARALTTLRLVGRVPDPLAAGGDTAARKSSLPPIGDATRSQAVDGGEPERTAPLATPTTTRTLSGRDPAAKTLEVDGSVEDRHRAEAR